MICPDCAAAADYDAEKHPVEMITTEQFVQREQVRRGHDRCARRQAKTALELLVDEGFTAEHADLTAGGQCDCQHLTRAVLLG